MQTSQSTGFAWSRTSLSFVIRHHFFLFHSIRDGRVVKPAMPVLFAFMGPVGLLAWRWVCVSLHCENRRFRNGQRKQIIRTHLLLETSSDYIGLALHPNFDTRDDCSKRVQLEGENQVRRMRLLPIGFPGRMAGCTRTGCNFSTQKCRCTRTGCRCTRF